jgi:hypothetical protein
MHDYTTKSAVLFLIFNRPDVTNRVFEAIKAAKPSRLYIAADGPRADRPEEFTLCEQARKIVSSVDWECDVQTMFRPTNLGCKNAMSSAIDWFFDKEEEGIILEDDCLPSQSFFHYCDTLLAKYRFDTRIRHIAGSNLQKGKTWGDASIYFTNQTHVWGWASWRRVWNDYDKELTKYDEQEVYEKLSNIFTDQFVLEEWTKIFRQLKAGEIDTWDYQLAFTNFFNNGLSINPNLNMITNIGFREDATHTRSASSPYANIPLQELWQITYPTYILPEKKADYALFTYDFNLQVRWKKHNKLNNRLKRWLRGPL